MIFRLDDKLVFPDTSLAEEDGLLAIGGDLSTKRLLLAYSLGIFPWYSEEYPIMWYAPKERFVLFPEKVRLSKSLAKKMANDVFEITQNKAFSKVIDHCAKVSRVGQSGTWITQEMRAAYISLHEKGITKSIEVWQQGELVGGLYGVDMGTVFCGESMFHRVSDASKVELMFLANKKNFKLIDCQVYTDHLASLGAEFISMNSYKSYLNADKVH